MGDVQSREDYLASAPSFILASQAPAALRRADQAKSGAMMAGGVTAISLLLVVISFAGSGTPVLAEVFWVVLSCLFAAVTCAEIIEVRASRTRHDEVVDELALRGETPSSATEAHYVAMDERLREIEADSQRTCAVCGSPCLSCTPGST